MSSLLKDPGKRTSGSVLHVINLLITQDRTSIIYVESNTGRGFLSILLTPGRPWGVRCVCGMNGKLASSAMRVFPRLLSLTSTL